MRRRWPSRRHCPAPRWPRPSSRVITSRMRVTGTPAGEHPRIQRDGRRMTSRRELYAGVMSGTSLDGIDAVLADFSQEATPCTLLAATHIAFPTDLRHDLLALQARHPRRDRAHGARRQCARRPLRARTAQRLSRGRHCRARRGGSGRARADGAPPAAGGLDTADQQSGARRRTGVHDGRGGFPRARHRGGRAGRAAGAGLSCGDLRAWPTGTASSPTSAASPTSPTCRRAASYAVSIPGPGNVLLDLWHARHRGGTFDADGAWSATGRVEPALLAALLDEPYFALPPPKSTGRDLFHAPWLDAVLARTGWHGPAENVQATLVAFTARTLADAVREHAQGAVELLVCGGGARNPVLMAALARELPGPPRAHHRYRRRRQRSRRSARVRLARARNARRAVPATCRR